MSRWEVCMVCVMTGSDAKFTILASPEDAVNISSACETLSAETEDTQQAFSFNFSLILAHIRLLKSKVIKYMAVIQPAGGPNTHKWPPL